jgi:methyltransferase-like protein 6
MSAELVRALRKIGAERIVYVSCNPATQARDLARFFQTNDNENGNENGNGNENASSDVGTGDRNTPHVETVAVLLRVDDGPRDAVDEAR